METMKTTVTDSQESAATLYAREIEHCKDLLDQPGDEVLHARIDALRDARRQMASPDVDALLDQAGALRAKAQQRIGRTNAVLRELADLEGPHVVWVPTAHGPRAHGGASREWHNVNLRGPQSFKLAATRTQELFNEAARLERKAATARSRDRLDNGHLDATSKGDALAQLEALAPAVIGPRYDTVCRWLEKVTSGLPDGFTLNIHIEWRHGLLDREASTVQLATARGAVAAG